MADRGNPDTATPDAEQRTTFRRRSRPDPECGNCQGRGCMSCVFREYDHTCVDDCPTCCEPGMYRPYVFKGRNTGYWIVVWRGRRYACYLWSTAIGYATDPGALAMLQEARWSRVLAEGAP